MSDVNLLIFGCVVSFVAAAGVYVHVRECFTAAEEPRESEAARAAADDQKLHDAA